MRNTGILDGIDALEPGDHLGWVAGRDGFEGVRQRLLDQAASSGDPIFVFGPHSSLRTLTTTGRALLADPCREVLRGRSFSAELMLDMFRREASSAADEGRTLRVIADMDWLLPLAPAPDDLMAFELALDEVVASFGASVVCAYRTDTFEAKDIAHVMCAHPLTLGAAPAALGFGMWSSGPGRWEVSGEVDAFNADQFRLALQTATSTASTARLRLHDLTFIDAAGTAAIARVARSSPSVTIEIERPTTTFRRCWTLLGYDRAIPSVKVLP